MSVIDLYGCGSPNVCKVLFMLAEAGLEYRFHSVDVHSGQQYTPEFLALNPNGKVPVIVDADGPNGVPHTVFESGAILIYLAEKSGRLLPLDPAARSQTMQWLMFQMASIGPMFGQALHFRYIATADQEYGRNRYLIEVERLYDVLERRLAAVPHLAGEEFTIADIAAFPWVGRYPKTLEIDLASRPHVRDWIERVEARPAQQRVAPLCKALFKATLEIQQSATPASLDRFFGRVRG